MGVALHGWDWNLRLMGTGGSLVRNSSPGGIGIWEKMEPLPVRRMYIRMHGD